MQESNEGNLEINNNQTTRTLDTIYLSDGNKEAHDSIL